MSLESRIIRLEEKLGTRDPVTRRLAGMTDEELIAEMLEIAFLMATDETRTEENRGEALRIAGKVREEIDGWAKWRSRSDVADAIAANRAAGHIPPDYIPSLIGNGCESRPADYSRRLAAQVRIMAAVDAIELLTGTLH